jgi:hypothetical protein
MSETAISADEYRFLFYYLLALAVMFFLGWAAGSRRR